MLVERYRPTRCEPGWVLAEDRFAPGLQVAVLPLPAACASADFEERLRVWGELGGPGLLAAQALGSGTEADAPLGVAPGQPYLVFAEDQLAGTLAWDAVGAQLSPQQRLAVAVQACWTLHRAHEAGHVLGVPGGSALRVSREGGTASAAWVAPAPAAHEDLADDLFALGVCLQAGLPEEPAADSDRLLATLCARLQDPVADRRPAARESMQRLLEWAPSSSVRFGALQGVALRGHDELLEGLLRVARARLAGDAAAPAWILLEGEPGCGAASLLRELGRRLRLEGHPAREGPAELERGFVWVTEVDQLGADALRELSRATREAAIARRPLLVALAGARSEAARGELEALRAVSPPGVFALGPLERAEVARLLEGVLSRPAPDVLLDLVERWSGGNLRRVGATLARLEEVGALVAGPTGARLVPELLAGLPSTLPDDAEVFPSQVTRDERRVLRGLCVSAQPVPRSALEALVGLAAGAVDRAAERLLELGVLVEQGEALGFRRAYRRVRVLEGLSSREEGALRRAHVVWLEQRPLEAAVCSALADHALALGDAERAARYVPLAAEADVRAEAPLRALERRLAWRPLLGSLPATARFEAWRDLGDALLAAGRVAAADEAFGSALATRSPKVDALARVALHRRRAVCALRRGDAAEAAGFLERARRALERSSAPDPAEAQRLLGLEVQQALKAGDRGRVLELTDGVLEGEALERGRGSLLNLRGLAHFHLGEPEAARRCFEASLRISEQLELQVGVAVVLGNLALVEDYEGHPEAAEALHLRSLDVARAAGIPGQAGAAASNLGNLANRAGRLALARERYRESLALAAEIGDDEALCMGLCALADVCLAQGDPRHALPYAERALALARVIGVPYCEALALVNLGDALAQLGRLEEALSAAERAVELRSGLGEPARLARALALLARVAVLAGDDARAREAAERARAALGDDPPPVAEAEVALVGGDLARAEACFHRAHDRLGGVRVGLARAGELPAAEALRHAERCLAEAEACGAQALAAEAELLRAAASPGDERALDRVRAVRSFAHRFELPELARRAAGTLARLHDAREEPLEAGAARLDARRVLDAQCAGLPLALAKRLRARPAVLRDTQADEVDESPRVAAPLTPTSRAEAPAPSLADCLSAAATLLRAPRCALVRTGGEPVLVDACDPAGDPGALTPDEASALRGDSTPSTLLQPVPGRAAALLVSRSEPFGAAEQQVAAGLALALVAHVPQVAQGGLRPLRPAEGSLLLGRSSAIQAVNRQIERFGPHRLPVLIQGESGTGKELAARALHAASPRSEGPFVAVNASGFSEELAASELFGVVRGAFTGAHDDRPGIFELAHRGTLFLDEVADASPAVQAMLLRVLEEGEIRPVGGTESFAVDVRVVCASLRDLAQEVEAGAFRRDLYYRLCGLALRLPPLRDRGEDVRLLAEHMLARAAAEGRRLAELSPEALRRLEQHPWPGNVRELRNTLERALALGSGRRIEVADLGLPAAADPDAVPGSLGALEREAIARALAEHETLTAAAGALGIHRRTLRRRMERYGLLDR